MSHTVTVTRTTTTSSTSVFLLNIGYLKKIPGILKVAHIVLGVICVGLSAHYLSSHCGRGHQAWDYYLFSPELNFLLMTTTFMITSTLLLVSCLISIASATILPKTVFEIVYHGTGTVLLFCASVAYMVQVNQSKGRYFSTSDGYNGRIAAAVLGFINTILYGVACFFAWRNYKGS